MNWKLISDAGHAQVERCKMTVVSDDEPKYTSASGIFCCGDSRQFRHNFDGDLRMSAKMSRMKIDYNYKVSWFILINAFNPLSIESKALKPHLESFQKFMAKVWKSTNWKLSSRGPTFKQALCSYLLYYLENFWTINSSSSPIFLIVVLKAVLACLNTCLNKWADREAENTAML